MSVQQLVVIPVLSQEGVSACPSTLPSCSCFQSSTNVYIHRIQGVVRELLSTYNFGCMYMYFLLSGTGIY